MSGRRMQDGRYGKVYKDKLTKTFLETEYSINHKSPSQIAEIVGCSINVVYDYIDYHGIKRIDMKGRLEEGDVFFFLTLIKVVGKSKNGTHKWLCQCKCGNEAVVTTPQLKSGKTKSCGCYKKRKKSEHHLWKGYCDISGRLVSEIRLRAKKKGLAFTIDAKFLWELLQKQDSRCALSGTHINIDNNASVDRINSKKGYTKNNVWWVDKDINKMKMDLPLKRFIELCEKVARYNGKEA
jgi:hypothetical protein